MIFLIFYCVFSYIFLHGIQGEFCKEKKQTLKLYVRLLAPFFAPYILGCLVATAQMINRRALNRMQRIERQREALEAGLIAAAFYGNRKKNESEVKK